VLKISSASENKLLAELGNMKLSSFLEKYGSKWRWAVLIHLISLIKKLDIQELDFESLAFTTIFKENEDEKSTSEEVEEFFQAFYNLINKLCLVQTTITPYPNKNNENQGKYLIV
jgi:hypothetical protein